MHVHGSYDRAPSTYYWAGLNDCDREFASDLVWCSLTSVSSIKSAIMSGRELPKVADAEKESLYGFVFGVSGPGEGM